MRLSKARKPELVDDEKPDLGVVVQAPFEGACGLLGAEIEQELGGGEEEDGAAGEDGTVGDVLGDHRLAEATRGDEDDVARALEKVEREERFDERPVDGRWASSSRSRPWA